MNFPPRLPRLRTVTNVDLESLASSDAVRAFMLRVLDDFRDPETGEVLASALADAAANTFNMLVVEMVKEHERMRVPAALYATAADVAASAGRRRAR